MGGLTPKQKRFVDEYLVDGNATQAAIRAGYSPKTAYSAGERLLRNVEISSLVAAGQKALQQKANITAKDVVQGFIDIWKNSTQLVACTEKDGSPILDKDGNQVYEVLNAKAANTALENLGKHLGLYVEKVESKEQVQVVYSWQE